MMINLKHNNGIGKKTNQVKNNALNKRSSFMTSLAETAAHFGEDSTLHGLKNIMMSIRSPTRTSRQRLIRAISLTIWILSCAIGITFAIVLIYLVWTKFQSTPTITTVESNKYPIWNINFPGVTICNNNKVWTPRSANITDKLMDQGVSYDRVRSFYVQLTKLVFFDGVDDTFEDVLTALEAINITTEHLMYEVMQPCDMLLDRCKWLGQSMQCDKMFLVATSEEGFCCSFNYRPPLDSLEVDTDHDYIDDVPAEVPYRVSGAGQFVGVDLLIHIDTEDYLAYAASYYGVTIMIHGSSNFPTLSDRVIIGQPGQDVTISVIPTVVVSEPAIRSLPLKQRNCYFEDESSLNTTSRYTYELCISECAVETIYRTCSCLPFYYSEVHLRQYSGFNRQCTLRDVNCLHDNRHIFASLQPDGVNKTLGMQCAHCLPSCSSESFSVQTIMAKRSDSNPLPSRRSPGVNLTNYVTLRVHFKDVSCIKYRRDVMMTWDGLFASFGGIFGLCLGGSVISMVELFYYFTVRLFNSYSGDDMDVSKDPSAEWNLKRPSLLNEREKRNILSYPKISTVMHQPSHKIHEPPAYGRYLD